MSVHHRISFPFRLYNNTCPHYVIVKWRMMPFFKQDRLDKYVYLVNIEPKVSGHS